MSRKKTQTITPQPVPDVKPDAIKNVSESIENKIEMSKDDYTIMEDIIAMANGMVGPYEVKLLQVFGQTYINQDLHICSHCDAQVRLAYTQITNWISVNKDSIVII